MSGRIPPEWLRAVARGSGVAFACIVLGAMASAVWFVSDKTKSFDENRTLNEAPQLRRFLEPGYEFGQRFERWLGDHFPRRKAMVRLSNQMRLRGNSRVLYGREGWLFSTLFGAPEVFSNANRFDADQLETLRRRTAEFGRRAKASGIGRVYFTFCNDKESVCREFYPAGYAKKHPESRLDQLWNALQCVTDDVTLVRFTDQLMRLKEKTEVFSRCGTHMNNLSSYLVYDWLSEVIAADFPAFARVRPDACHFGRNRRHTDVDLLKLGAVPFYDDAYRESDFAELRARRAVVTMRENRREEIVRDVHHMRNARAGNRLRLFLLTDSFGLAWSPYLAESVMETHVVFIGNDDSFVLSARERRELLEMKPDILIVNFTERFLQRLLTLEFPKEAD